MKSKYIKIFMIFAVVFAMVAALFVAPKAAYADEQVQLNAREEYDVNAITTSIPDTAIISFPVPYESVYGNEIDWEVQAEQSVLSFDDEANWVVVNRPTEGEEQTVKLYLKLNGRVVKTFPIKVPAGQTAVPSYSYKLDYNYDEKVEEGTYKLGEASITLPKNPTREGYIFNGWKDAEGKVYTKILVGSMENIELTAEWTKIVVNRIELDTTNLVKSDYISGDSLNTEGLVVTAYFNDGTNRVVTEGIEFDTKRVEYNDSEKVTITVTYQGKSASYEVSVSKKVNSVVIADFNGWTYGTPVVPTATSTYGTPILLYSNSEKGVYSEEAPTNAGVYYVKAVVEEGADFLATECDPVRFEIAKKDITLTPASQGTVNIADVQNLKWSFTTNDLVYEDSLPEEYEGLVVKYYLEENGEPVNPMAGQVYIVKFSGFTMDNYRVTFVDGSLSVKSEELYFDIPNVEYVYDGTIKMFTATAYSKGSGNEPVKITDAEVVYTYNDQPFTGAESANEEGYLVKVSIDSPLYGYLEQEYTFVIKRAEINTNSVTLTDDSKEYNRNNQMISVQGLPEDDKLVVSYNITEAINVGTYDVVATISSKDPNYKVSKSEFTATLVITQADNLVTVEIEGWTYGQEAKVPTVRATFGEVTYKFFKEDGTELAECPTDAGTYYVKATVAGTDNYEAASAIQEFTIAQAVIDLSNATLTDDSKEYNSKNQMISVQGLPEDDKLVVSYNITEAINVGTYDVVATISSKDPNYKVSVDKLTATLIITQADNSVTVEIQGWTYGDEAKAPTATATFGEVTYKFFKEDGTELAECPKDAGNYYVEATVEGTDNYEGATDTASFTISKKLLTNDDVKVIVLGSDYNTSVKTTLTPDVEVYYNQTQITTYGELQYEYEDAETKLGTATVTIVLNGNYEGTLTATFVVTKFGQAGVDAAGLPKAIDEAYLTANELPVTVGEGDVESNVLWSSSNTAVSVNPVSGQVSINKAQLSENTTVILTAIVTYGTTSSYVKEYNVTIYKAPVSENLTDGDVTIYDAPYGYDIEAKEVTDTNDNANYKAAVEANEGYEYVKAYNISLKDELGQSPQPGKTVKVRINGSFDTSKVYKVYYVDGSSTTEIEQIKVDATYIEFETNHFSIYAIAVEEEVQEDTNDYLTAKNTYTFANYPAGTQYAVDELHELDSYITVTTTQAHFTTQLRLYSSDTYNSFAIIKCNGLINGLTFNAGYKVDTLNVYGSTDGAEWTPIDGVDITSTSYKDYTVAGPFEYKYIKLDVAGSQQIRIASITVSFKYEECKHTELENVDRKEPTCTEIGYTAGVICSSCKEVQSGVEEIPALQHSFVNGTCSKCGEEDPETPDEPNQGQWTLVTNVDQLAVGKKIVIVATEFNYAMSTTQNTNNRGQASVTKSGNNITFGDDVQVFTLENGKTADTFAFNTGKGYLYAASSGSNHLKTQTTLNENGSWNITVTSDGVATIKATGSNTRNWMRYNSTNNPPIFSSYGSGQADISIYIYNE